MRYNEYDLNITRNRDKLCKSFCLREAEVCVHSI